MNLCVCVNILNSAPSSSCEAVLGADGEKGGEGQVQRAGHQPKEGDHPTKELKVGVMDSRQMSVGSAPENQGARGLSTESPD